MQVWMCAVKLYLTKQKHKKPSCLDTMLFDKAKTLKGTLFGYNVIWQNKNTKSHLVRIRCYLTKQKHKKPPCVDTMLFDKAKTQKATLFGYNVIWQNKKHKKPPCLGHIQCFLSEQEHKKYNLFFVWKCDLFLRNTRKTDLHFVFCKILFDK